MRGPAIIIAALLLASCAKPIPVTPDPVAMPVLPEYLAAPADPLPPIEGDDLDALIRDGIATDLAYSELRSRHNAVTTAWECVRVALRDSTDATRCFDGGR